MLILHFSPQLHSESLSERAFGQLFYAWKEKKKEENEAYFIFSEFLDGSSGVLYTSFAGLIVAELLSNLLPASEPYLFEVVKTR